MANPEHLAKLKEGVEVWNAWREGNPAVRADLNRADLSRSDLNGANLRGVDLYGVDLSEANLYGVDLSGANLSGANLIGANLVGADLIGAYLGAANLLATTFADADLSDAVGLDKCYHSGPSIVDHHTLAKSQNVPLAFWQGTGLQEWQVVASRLHNPKLTPAEITDIVHEVERLRNKNPIQLHNLFISYTHDDGKFADHIEAHLHKKNILFWRDIHDAASGPIGEIVRLAMDNRTVLLVLSDRSVNSDWVEYEAQKARELEQALGRHVLCPIALDDSWKKCAWSEVLHNQMQKYNILDFSDWHDEASFKGKFERLVKMLDLFYRE